MYSKLLKIAHFWKSELGKYESLNQKCLLSSVGTRIEKMKTKAKQNRAKINVFSMIFNIPQIIHMLTQTRIYTQVRTQAHTGLHPSTHRSAPNHTQVHTQAHTGPHTSTHYTVTLLLCIRCFESQILYL